MVRIAARILLTIAIVTVAAFGARALWEYYLFSPWTRDGRVEADVVDIAPDVSGFVRDLGVKDNQFVRKGGVLLVLDQDRYKLALVTATANVAARRAQMEMQQRIAERRAKLTTLSTSVEEQQNAAYSANVAVAAYDQALADLATARLNLDRTVIYAPVNGYVTHLTLDVGQYASVGSRVMALIDSDSYHVDGYFEETKIPKVQRGQPVKVYLLSGGPPLDGHIESISHGITNSDNGNGPELLANPAPTFEWVRLAQRIPVRIHIDEIPAGVDVSAGMTCTVVVDGTASRPDVISLQTGPDEGHPM